MMLAVRKYMMPSLWSAGVGMLLKSLAEKKLRKL